MANYNHLIEDWWENLGCFDREQASGIKYNGADNYLNITDYWWDNLSDIQKKTIYNTFFEEY